MTGSVLGGHGGQEGKLNGFRVQLASAREHKDHQLKKSANTITTKLEHHPSSSLSIFNM